MKTKKHRPGVNENYLMNRHLQLEGLKEEYRAPIIAEIEALIGVDTISITENENVLSVSYDASKRNLGEVEEILRRYECDVAHDWWTNFKERWYKTTDQNVRENAEHVPWTCHKPPR